MIRTDTIVPEEHKPVEIWRLYKNIIVIGLAFMIHFTSYHGAADLQSSINAEAGLGTASLAAVYAGLLFSGIFLPTAVIKYLGLKWAIAVSLLCYMPYIVFQMWSSFYTLIPSAFVLGLGAGPLWCAVSVYISVVAETHSKASKVPKEVLYPRFFGMFFAFSSLSTVWGNLISSLVLRSGGNKAALTNLNATLIPELCGANFLPSSDAKKVLQHQPEEKIQMLVAIYVACIVGAVLIVIFGVDSMKKYHSEQATSTKLSGSALLAVTVKQLKEPDQLLLIIISMFIGVQNVFFTAGISAAYVSCSIGTGSVGFVMMAHGITDVVSSVVVAFLSKIIKRIVLLTITFIIYLVLLTFMLLWKVQADSETIMYSVALLWGFCSTNFLVQINAYYGLLFPDKKEAAFSNFRIWKAIGYIIAYVTSHIMRTRDKIYLVYVVLILGVLCYYVIEWRTKMKKKNLLSESPTSSISAHLPVAAGVVNPVFNDLDRIKFQVN